MAAIYFPGLVQIVPQYNIGAPSLAANVTHWFGTEESYTNTQLQTVQSAFNSGWANLWSPNASSVDSFVGAIVTDVGSNTGLQVSNAGFTPVHGLGSGAPLADNTSILLSLHQLLRYRGGHGRLYIPGITEQVTNSDGRTIQTSTLTLLSTNWASLVAAMAAISGGQGGPYTPVVWHKHLLSAPNTIANITGMTPQPVMATQRRRLRKVARRRSRAVVL